jgi:hypothetical protein
VFAQQVAGPAEFWFTDIAEGDLTDAHHVAALRERLRLPLIASMRQVHGTDAVWAQPGVVPEADALLTYAPGVALIARVADCVPIVLAADDGGHVAVVHAGRRGLVDGVVAKAARTMREHRGGPVTAWVGPRICGGCYELDAATADAVAHAVPEAAATTRWDTPGADIGAGVIAQLRAGDVAVHDLGGCTLEDDRFFSYRRDGTAQRQAAVVVLREET